MSFLCSKQLFSFEIISTMLNLVIIGRKISGAFFSSNFVIICFNSVRLTPDKRHITSKQACREINTDV